MKNPFPRIILTLFFIFLMGCARQEQQIPKTHILWGQKNQALLIEELTQNLTKKRQIIIQHAIENLGQPYKWGGKSPGQGFDCSGLVFYTHDKAGLWVPRTTKDQLKMGRPLSRQALVPGDLVFFDIPGKKTGLHVGIFVGKEQFIHAPGHGRRVRLASLNNSYFNQNFKGARSYFGK